MATTETQPLPRATLEALQSDAFDKQLRMMLKRTYWAAQDGFDFRVAAYNLPRALFDSVQDCQDPRERMTLTNPEDPVWMKMVSDHVTIYTKEPPHQESTKGPAQDVSGDQDGENENSSDASDQDTDYHIFLLRGESLELPVYKEYKFELDRSCPGCPSKMQPYGDLRDMPDSSDSKRIWECRKCETRVIQTFRLEDTAWEPGPRGRVLKAPV